MQNPPSLEIFCFNKQTKKKKQEYQNSLIQIPHSGQSGLREHN